MNAPALRPLGMGEILDVGIKIYWRNAWTLFRIVIFVVLPTQLLVTAIQVSALPSGGTLQPDFSFGTPGLQTGNASNVSGRDATTFFVGTVIAVVLNALAGKLAQAACFRAVANAYLGEPVTWRESLRYGLKRLPAVVGVSIIATLAATIGFVFCIIPGVYLWAAFYVAIPVVLVEGVGPIRALGRSRELVQGRWWATFGVAVVGYVLVLVIASVFTALLFGIVAVSPHSTVAAFVTSAFSTTMSSMLTTPAIAAFATVLYIDLRVRKEGFDLLLLAQRLGVEPREGASTTASYLPPAPAYPAEGAEQPPFWPPPPGWTPSGAGAVESPPEALPSGDEPPFWPPPPGWTPGGGGAVEPPPEAQRSGDEPPFWPPPPGWTPSGE